MIILDGLALTDKQRAHRYVKLQVGFPEYYGENLDALWDILSAVSKPTHIVLINPEELTANLGEYADLFIAVFLEAAEANKALKFEIL